MEQLQELKKLIDEVVRVYESAAEWKVKYDLIFSEHLSRRICDIVCIEYYDPDTSYEEDVRAYVVALLRYREAI